MGVVFAVRGDSLNARYSSQGKTPCKFGTNVASVVASESGLISAGYIDLQNSSNGLHAAVYPGFKNWSANAAFSVLMRLKVVSTSGTVALWSASMGYFTSSVEFWLASGSLSMEMDSETGASAVTGSGAWAPSSSNYYDVVITSTGVGGANGTKVYIDGTLLFQATDVNPWPDPRVGLPAQIALGYAGSGLSTTRIKVDEFVIWDSVINPSSVVLDSGTAALNGMSRSSPVAVSAFDAMANVDPGVANVRNGTTYEISGVNLTGTAVIPSANDVRNGTAVDAGTGNMVEPTAANVKTGVAFGTNSTLTGTYDGSDRWSDPGDSNVRLATAYKANSTTNNKTGRVTVPSAANVKTGVAFETDAATNGTYDGSDRWTDPGVANVRTATQYNANSTTNNRTGTCAVPSPNDVRRLTAVDATTGNARIPVASQVAAGVHFDTNDTVVGTLQSVNNVIQGATLTGAQLTGTLTEG